MSRLTPLALQVGLRLEISGKRFVLSKCERISPFVELQPEGKTEAAKVVSRNELATLVATEQARILDDLEEPDLYPKSRRTCTDISHLSLSRMFDWHAKLYLLKSLSSMTSRSPKSKVFREAFANASAELTDWHAEMGTGHTADWSPWTVYHDILRWRYAGHDMAAVQKKGVEYTPWSRNRRLYDLAKEIAAAVLQKEPAISATGLHRHINKAFADRELDA